MFAPLRIRRLNNKGSGDDGFKSYLDRLLKLIPAEVLSLYVVGIGLVPETETLAAMAWAIFCLLAVIFVKAYGTGYDWIHVGISTVAFVLWIYSSGGPFKQLGLHQPYIGSLLILGFTFIVPYLYKGQPD